MQGSRRCHSFKNSSFIASLFRLLTLVFSLFPWLLYFKLNQIFRFSFSPSARSITKTRLNVLCSLHFALFITDLARLDYPGDILSNGSFSVLHIVLDVHKTDRTTNRWGSWRLREDRESGTCVLLLTVCLSQFRSTLLLQNNTIKA